MSHEASTLKKSIRLFEGIMFVIGFVIGSGVFLKPSVVLKDMGSPGAALSIWILGGLITICTALTIAELAANIPKVGGLYAYLTEIYGEKVGFLYGWVQAIIASPGSAGAIAIAFAMFATFFVPMNAFQQKSLAILVVSLLVIAQIISTRFGVWIQTISTIGKLIPLAAIILFGLANGTAHDFSFVSESVVKSAGTGTALLGVLWAYDGWISTCTLGSEMKHPEKDLPYAIVFGVLFVMAVYVLFNLAIFNVLPAAAVAASVSIGVDVSVKLFGTWGTAFITAGMLISVFGALNAQMASGARVSYAMGTEKQLPGSNALATISPKLNTPVNALILQGTLTILFILTGTFNSLTNLVIFVLWIFFTLGVGGVFILRKKGANNEKLYRVPLYPITPLLGIAGGLYLTYATIKDSFWGAMFGIGLTLAGLIVYHYCKKRSAEERTANS